jgi:hypothetical protein
MSDKFIIIAIIVVAVLAVAVNEARNNVADRIFDSYRQKNNEMASELQATRELADNLKYELSCSRAHPRYRIDHNGACRYPEFLGQAEVWVYDYEADIKKPIN